MEGARQVETTEEAEQKRVHDARLQLAINDAAAQHGEGSDPLVVEQTVVRELTRHGLQPPSDDWIIAVAAAICHGQPYIVSPESVQDAAAMQLGEYPEYGGPAAALAADRPAPAPAVVRPAPVTGAAAGQGEERDVAALVVTGVALLVALWAFRSRRR